MAIEKKISIASNANFTNISADLAYGEMSINIVTGLQLNRAKDMSLKELHEFPIKEAIRFLQSVLDGTA